MNSIHLVCEAFSKPENGEVRVDTTTEGSVATYYCIDEQRMCAVYSCVDGDLMRMDMASCDFENGEWLDDPSDCTSGGPTVSPSPSPTSHGRLEILIIT